MPYWIINSDETRIGPFSSKRDALKYSDMNTKSAVGSCPEIIKQ
jgi:hypothetical protein